MTITQGSQSGIVNWQSFSIGQGAAVDIHQPSANATLLNRVTGDTTSNIHGRLSANGTVHLVNPNGIFIGPTGTVNAGSFAASTLAISDEDFLAGRLRFKGAGSSAAVRNAGQVTIGRGGYAALIGGIVRNDGVVTVPMGRIGFAAGERVTLDLSGDQFLQVAMPSNGSDDDDALIENAGRVEAEGGLIEMRAATARHAARHAINLSGVAEASSVSVKGGTIYLGGGGGGQVTVTGQVLASSKRPPVRGGEVTITGSEITLAGAEIDISGGAGGGLARIGGDFEGQGDLPRADTLVVDADTIVRADALDAGDGGRVAFWSEVSTSFDGFVSARGGDAGGDGGFVEVSSRRDLDFHGLVDRRAPLGAWGTLLLDPDDITINPGAGGETALEANLALGDVQLDTAPPASIGSDPGNIVINADIDWTAATQLRLTADDDGTTSGTGGNLTMNGAFNGPNGRLVLDANNTITAGTGASINVDSLWLLDGSWVEVDTSLTPITTNSFETASFNTFLRALGGDGTLGNPYQLTDIFGVQGLESAALSNSNFVLVNDIDASGTATWVHAFGTGLEPIFGYAATFDGAGFAIDGLNAAFVAGGGPNDTALFASLTSSATVQNLSLTNVNIVGGNAAGLVVTNDGTINNVQVTGTVSGSGPNALFAGGLVGENSTGTISDSIADVDVSLTGETGSPFSVGGFVGVNESTINRSHALGDVTLINTEVGADAEAGGFVGFEEDVGMTINDSYARGNVTLISNVGSSANIAGGGFVGQFNGDINRSYSTGSVTTSGDATFFTGGFTGRLNGGTSTANFWDVNTSGEASSLAGTGLTTAQFQDTEAFFVIGLMAGWDFDDIWAPGDTGFYPVNYTTSPVVFATPTSFTVQYGQTPTASTTGVVEGGPVDFVFDSPSDVLDTSGLFSSLAYDAETVGSQSFSLATTSIDSSDGVTFRVVDRVSEVTITPAPLILTANDQVKTYGDTFAFSGTEFSITSGSLFFSDAVTSASLSSSGAPATAIVDSYGTTLASPVGTGLSNYTITLQSGDFDVVPAPLVITADNQIKTEGDSFTFAGTEFTAVGLRNADAVTSASLSSDGADAAAQAADSPFVINISNPQGSGLGNYAITLVPGTFLVGLENVTEIPVPPTFVSEPPYNPPDDAEPLPDTGTTASGGPASVEEVAAAEETLSEVENIAVSVDSDVDACSQSSGDVSRYLACLSDALSSFADELDTLVADLPPGMQDVAVIVQDARLQIDAARARAESRLATATTDAERAAIRADAFAESRAAVDFAAGEIRKAIALVRADDPELAAVERATVTRVAATVDNVGIQLTRAVEL